MMRFAALSIYLAEVEHRVAGGRPLREGDRMDIACPTCAAPFVGEPVEPYELDEATSEADPVTCAALARERLAATCPEHARIFVLP